MLNRRDLLKGAAAYALGARLWAAEGATLTAAPLRWGVIGAGTRGRVAHLPAIRSFPDMEILAVCDVTESHLAQGLRMAGSTAQGFSDYQKLLADPRIDAVAIATPAFLHREMVVAALQAGKHVLCEKPMSVDFASGTAMKRAAEAADRTVLYGTQHRYSLFYGEVRRQIEAGKIGAPTHAFFRLYRGDWNPNGWKYPDPKTGRSINWRYSQAASGGILCEEGVHYFDILSWMVGALPQSVVCRGGIGCYKSDGRDTWDHAMTTLTYGNGCLGFLELCLYGPSALEIQVMGDAGSLLAVPRSRSLTFRARARGAPETIPVPPETVHGMPGSSARVDPDVIAMYRDFQRCVREKRRPLVDSEKGYASSKTAWLANRSGVEGRELAWDAAG